jgi:type IV pilus assembly protein PilM
VENLIKNIYLLFESGDLMFEKDLITIEIGYKEIKIVCGNKNAIKAFGILQTPKGAYENDNLKDVAALASVISAFLKKEKIKTKEVSFVISGQDIVMRNVETPIMDRKGIYKTLQWEVSQYLPDGGAEYYFDYEIVDKIEKPGIKAYNVIVVSVPKQKIEKYMDLTAVLKLKISAIDIASNNAARVFSNINKLYRSFESIGIINLGNYNTTFTIIDKGKLSLSREFAFGITAAGRELYRTREVEPEDAAAAFIEEFSFLGNQESETFRAINGLFMTMMISVDKVIQFYTTGKTKKSLDAIYIIGEGSDIKGVSEYIKNYFNTGTEVPENLKSISLNMKHPSDMNFRNYANTIGLLLRKD